MAVNDTSIEVPCPRCGIRVNIRIKLRGVVLGLVGEAEVPGMVVEFNNGVSQHECPE